MNELFTLDNAKQYLDWEYLVLFMALTYVLKSPINDLLTYIAKQKTRRIYAVFIIGTLAAIPFWVLKHDHLKLLMTWAVGTAIHGLVIKWLLSLVSKFTNKTP